MHRAISIKHRVVRRVDIDRAPLATFDTVDLGDEDTTTAAPQVEESSQISVDLIDHVAKNQIFVSNKSGVFIEDGGLKSETIGGTNSKKSLSQAGGEDKESRDDRVKDKLGCSEVENVQQSKNTVTENLSSDAQKLEAAFVETVTQNTGLSETKRPEVLATESTLQKAGTVSSNFERNVVKDDAKTSTAVTSLVRQGTIGRVNIPIKKQDSDSSSSSPGSCNEATFTFQATRPSVGQFEKTITQGQTEVLEARKEASDSLQPEYLDPSQILSPSKRKAYERRIERLKVTTSPIARPRSNAPINVVSLIEYAAINAPDPSPLTPVVQDKLKITLPSDEFTSKPKTPKIHSAKRQNSEDNCFEFTEEFLFSRTKSALVVSDDGQLPLSPRRVLIPPNLTPATSPKLSTSPRLSPDSFHEEHTAEAPKPEFFQHNESPCTYFGTTVDESEEENWADFSEVSQLDEDDDSRLAAIYDVHVDQINLQSSAPNVTEVEWTKTDFAVNETIHNQSNPATIGALLDSPANILKSDLNLHAETVSLCSDISGNPFQNVSNGDIFKNGIDLTTQSLSGKKLADAALSSKKFVAEVSQVELDPNFESEEIITIEINQSATGCEKLIGIEITSGESSQIASSPVCFDLSSRSWGTTATSRDEDRTQQDSIHSSVRNVHSVQQYGLSSVNFTEAACSSQEVQQCLDSEKPDNLTDQRSEQDIISGFPLQFTDQISTPQTVHVYTVNNVVGAAQLLDDKPEPRQRPPSTNPFDVDFEPPQISNPFDVGLQYQPSCTNPFLEPHSSAPSDFIVFSSSLDNSSM